MVNTTKSQIFWKPELEADTYASK